MSCINYVLFLGHHTNHLIWNDLNEYYIKDFPVSMDVNKSLVAH